MNIDLRSQKGATLKKVIIIIVIIIGAILFIIWGTTPKNGIKSVEEATRDYERTKEKSDKLNQEYINTLEDYSEKKEKLEELERKYNYNY